MHSQEIYRDTLLRVIQPRAHWLDIGCGHTILPTWMRNSIAIQRQLLDRCEFACGCDPVDVQPHVAGLRKCLITTRELPFPEGSFTIVTANMVVEHVEQPQPFLREIWRVLQPEGKLVIHTPNLLYPPVLAASLLPKKFVRNFVRRLDHRDPEDIFPTRYRLNTRRAFEHIQGFHLEHLRCVPTAPLLDRIPILGPLERVYLELVHSLHLRNFSADWIVILTKATLQSFVDPALPDAHLPNPARPGDSVTMH